MKYHSLRIFFVKPETFFILINFKSSDQEGAIMTTFILRKVEIIYWLSWNFINFWSIKFEGSYKSFDFKAFMILSNWVSHQSWIDIRKLIEPAEFTDTVEIFIKEAIVFLMERNVELCIHCVELEKRIFHWSRELNWLTANLALKSELSHNVFAFLTSCFAQANIYRAVLGLVFVISTIYREGCSVCIKMNALRFKLIERIGVIESFNQCLLHVVRIFKQIQNELQSFWMMDRGFSHITFFDRYFVSHWSIVGLDSFI